MKFFKSPYTIYYNILKKNNNNSIILNMTANKINNAVNVLNCVNAGIYVSSWKEAGVEELSSNIISNLSKNLSIFYSNYVLLSEMSSKVFGSLYFALNNLKESDEEYEKACEELEQLEVVQQYDSLGNENPAYSSYISKKEELNTKIEQLRIKCEEYMKECDSVYNSIKSLDGSFNMFEDEGLRLLNGKNDDTAFILKSIEEGKLIKWTFNGKEYYMPNTKINAFNYECHIADEMLIQSDSLCHGLGGVCQDDCQMLALYYIIDMMRGTKITRADIRNNTDKAKGCYNKTDENVMVSENKEEVLKYVYDELLEGHPVALQVSQENSDVDGSRHWVAVVGFDESVKNYEDLTPENILVIDCVDGKIQTLADGHDRDLYMWEGVYQARSGDHDFINEQVENEKWENTYSQYWGGGKTEAEKWDNRYGYPSEMPNNTEWHERYDANNLPSNEELRSSVKQIENQEGKVVGSKKKNAM